MGLWSVIFKRREKFTLENDEIQNAASPTATPTSPQMTDIREANTMTMVKPLPNKKKIRQERKMAKLEFEAKQRKLEQELKIEPAAEVVEDNKKGKKHTALFNEIQNNLESSLNQTREILRGLEKIYEQSD